MSDEAYYLYDGLPLCVVITNLCEGFDVFPVKSELSSTRWHRHKAHENDTSSTCPSAIYLDEDLMIFVLRLWVNPILILAYL